MDLSSISRCYSVLILANIRITWKVTAPYNAKDMGSKPLLNCKSVNSISIAYLRHLIATLYSTEVVTNQSECIFNAFPAIFIISWPSSKTSTRVQNCKWNWPHPAFVLYSGQECSSCSIYITCHNIHNPTIAITYSLYVPQTPPSR